MPRRKQQAPKRAAVYEPDEDNPAPEEEEPLAEDDGENDGQTEEEEQRSERTSPKEGCCEDRELDSKSTNTYSNQNSPGSAFSSQEAELESRLSDSSDRLSDFKTSPPPPLPPPPTESRRDEESRGVGVGVGRPPRDETAGSLEKMRAAYANFLSDSYWTGAEPRAERAASKANCDSTNGAGARGDFDWHQDALSKTLQQTLSPKPASSSSSSSSKPNLFSSVHLYRQSASKPCGGAVFTGASRFRCKDCSAAYDTLVELTVHMNKSGHYQDNNHGKAGGGGGGGSSGSSSRSRKRSLQDLEGKEDAQKVLKCMFCGHSFDSLQDLSVHMIKTKHYQKVPLKEPIPVITPKLLPPAKKRAAFEAARPCSPDSTTGAAAGFAEAQRAAAAAAAAAASSASGGNRYGYQNGASYTWQFETCKSQILKCMECGSSHDTLQQLTTHMMVTGHFIKVTNSASKKGKQLALDPLAIEKIQGLAEPAEADKLSPKDASPGGGGGEKDGAPDKTEETGGDDDDKLEGEEQKAGGGGGFKYPYLREEDLEKDSGGGGDILKSLANTVASAINKAQTGTPSWSAYPSIHAAYQLSGIIKSAAPLSSASSPPAQLKQTFNHHKLRPIAPKGKPYHGEGPRHGGADDARKEKKGGGDGSKESLKFEPAENDDSDCQDDSSSSSKLDEDGEAVRGKASPDFSDRGGKTPSPAGGGGGGRGAAASEPLGDGPELLGVNPLSALQSVLNNHLGKANKPGNGRPDRPPALALAGSLRSRTSGNFLFAGGGGDDQPIDLTKSKHARHAAPPPPPPPPSAPLPQKYALSDIADMVKVLPKATTPKPSGAARGVPPALKLESDVRRFEDVSAEVYSVHKRKGRQSNWNPRHLLILQAQFASSLFQTSEGKYLLSDLGPQERMHISKFTGLSMTTISHWLANVKYQLRKTGGTKFLKNMDTGHPVFYCNDCASQFRSPPAFIAHLESHLGFQIRDMCKMPAEHRTKAEEPELAGAPPPPPPPPPGARPPEPPAPPDEDADSKFKCKLCCRTFASNHAVKLHLSKTHSKSPDNHSQYVEMDKD